MIPGRSERYVWKSAMAPAQSLRPSFASPRRKVALAASGCSGCSVRKVVSASSAPAKSPLRRAACASPMRAIARSASLAPGSASTCSKAATAESQSPLRRARSPWCTASMGSGVGVGVGAGSVVAVGGGGVDASVGAWAAPSGVCRQAASRRETTTASRDRVKRFWCIIGGIIPVYTEVVNETILLTASGTVRTSTRTDQESGYAPFVRCPELWHNRARLYPESSLLAYSRSRRACPRGRRAPRRQGDEHGGPAGGVGSEGGDQRVRHRR